MCLEELPVGAIGSTRVILTPVVDPNFSLP